MLSLESWHLLRIFLSRLVADLVFRGVWEPNCLTESDWIL